MLSFVILDDLKPVYGPIHETLDITSLEQGVRKIIATLNEYADPSSYYQTIDEGEIYTIVYKLLCDGYFVRNQFNKYYVIAFSLNFTECKVFSRDCDGIITWK